MADQQGLAKRGASAPGNRRTTIEGSTPRNKLTIRGQEDGYHYHIINADQRGRLEELQQRGYEVVTHDLKVGDNRVDAATSAGSPHEVPLGGGTKGLVVRIKQEWYDEDQKLVEQRNDAVANALTGGMIGAEKDVAGDSNMRYVDKSRTKIPELFTKKRPKAAA